MTNRDTTTPSDDWLERALVADARDHAHEVIADDGFTARVMGALPAPAALPAWRRYIVFALWGVIVAASVLALPSAVDAVARAIFALFSGYAFSLAQVGLALSIAALATWTATVFALRRE
jgi:hypothetical protein